MVTRPPHPFSPIPAMTRATSRSCYSPTSIKFGSSTGSGSCPRNKANKTCAPVRDQTTLRFMLLQTGRQLSYAMIITLLITSAAGIPMRAQAAGPAQQPTPSSPADVSAETIPLFGRWETSFALAENYSNPYDPAEIDVTATFRSPNGSSVRVPGFFMQPYEDQCTPADCPAEDLQPTGEPAWHVRFTPNEVGSWEYTIEARDAGGTETIQSDTFDVTASDNPGFVRTSGRYFAFDSGSAYFPVGENLGWSSDESGGIYAYERWLDRL
ncbi:MAG: DUF5060 domain-containing protein, partial [Chloroflexi bacterium]